MSSIALDLVSRFFYIIKDIRPETTRQHTWQAVLARCVLCEITIDLVFDRAFQSTP